MALRTQQYIESVALAQPLALAGKAEWAGLAGWSGWLGWVWLRLLLAGCPIAQCFRMSQAALALCAFLMKPVTCRATQRGRTRWPAGCLGSAGLGLAGLDLDGPITIVEIPNEISTC